MGKVIHENEIRALYLSGKTKYIKQGSKMITLIAKIKAKKGNEKDVHSRACD